MIDIKSVGEAISGVLSPITNMIDKVTTTIDEILTLGIALL